MVGSHSEREGVEDVLGVDGSSRVEVLYYGRVSGRESGACLVGRE